MDKKYKSLLNEYCHAKGILSPTYTTSVRGPAHAPYFVATIKVSGKEFKSSVQNNKKSAEEDAASLAYRHIVNDQQPSVHQQQQPPEILPELKAGTKLWRQSLYEWCQKTHREPPIFTYEQTGPPHNPQFSAIVELKFETPPLKFQSPFQYKKKQAEEDAAEIAVTFLRHKITSKASGESLKTSPISNMGNNTNLRNNPQTIPNTIPTTNLCNNPQTIPNTIPTTNLCNNPQTIPNTIPTTNLCNNPQTIPNTIPTNLCSDPTVSPKKKKKKKMNLQEFESRFKPPLPDLHSRPPQEVLEQYFHQHFGESLSYKLHRTSEGIWKFKIRLLGHIIGVGKHQSKDKAELEGYQNCFNYVQFLIQEDISNIFPKDLWNNVVSYMDITSMLRFGLTNRKWLDFAMENTVWENICKEKWPDSDPDPEVEPKRQWFTLFSMYSTSELIDDWESKLEDVLDEEHYEESISVRDGMSFWKYIAHLRHCYCQSKNENEEDLKLDPDGLFQILISSVPTKIKK